MEMIKRFLYSFKKTTLIARAAVKSRKMSKFDEAFPMPVQKNGQFFLPWPHDPHPGFLYFLSQIIKYKDESNIPSHQELDEIPEMQVLTPDKQKLNAPDNSSVQVTWLGHATTLLQFDSLTVLTDPLLSAKTGPPVVGVQRYRQVPCHVSDLPQVHAVVISHDHYDHLDLPTVQLLHKRFGDDLKWMVPLGMKSWLLSTGPSNVAELNWWEETKLHYTTTSEDNKKAESSIKEATFVCTPTQHWCRRTPMDTNQRLWGGWAIIGPTHRVYFPGDTGYCEHIFKMIGNKYGPFHVSCLPIGAYAPRPLMKNQHMDPEEAVRTHQLLKSKKSVGIHWGTLKLSYEFYLEPPRKVKTSLDKLGIPEDEFITIRHGETVTFNFGNNIPDTT